MDITIDIVKDYVAAQDIYLGTIPNLSERMAIAVVATRHNYSVALNEYDGYYYLNKPIDKSEYDISYYYNGIKHELQHIQIYIYKAEDMFNNIGLRFRYKKGKYSHIFHHKVLKIDTSYFTLSESIEYIINNIIKYTPSI